VKSGKIKGGVEVEGGVVGGVVRSTSGPAVGGAMTRMPASFGIVITGGGLTGGEIAGETDSASRFVEKWVALPAWSDLKVLLASLLPSTGVMLSSSPIMPFVLPRTSMLSLGAVGGSCDGAPDPKSENCTARLFAYVSYESI